MSFIGLPPELTTSQSYKTILDFKKLKLVLKFLTLGYLNLEHHNRVV